jgi:hypothetical protein
LDGSALQDASRGARIALGAAAAFPLVYSIVHFQDFSPDCEIDAPLPEARLEVVPALDWAHIESGVSGLALRTPF